MQPVALLIGRGEIGPDRFQLPSEGMDLSVELGSRPLGLSY